MRTEAGTEAVDLERVYREEGPKLRRAVFLFTRDRDAVDDAVAEAFAQALARGRRFGTPPVGSGASRSGSPAAR